MKTTAGRLGGEARGDIPTVKIWENSSTVINWLNGTSKCGLDTVAELGKPRTNHGSSGKKEGSNQWIGQLNLPNISSGNTKKVADTWANRRADGRTES